MPKLKPISGIELVRLFTRMGYEIDHQTGSHIILRNFIRPHRRLSVPNHDSISIGTLRAIIRQAGLTREEFQKLRD